MMADEINMQGASPSLPPSPDDMDADYDFEDKVGEDKDITGDGGVVKHILRKGESWETPEKGDEVTVHYVGTLLDGTKFDSSRDRGDPFVFKLGEGRVIKGWDAGVATMKRGELSRLTCKPDYAYGAAGSPPSIPPEATLVFEVELISWKSVKDITGDGGVIKTVVSEGSGWQHPKEEDEVLVTFSARITPPQPPAGKGKAPVSAADQGLPVVASSPEGGLTFTVKEAPCRGLAAAVRGMKIGESARLLLKPEYAAGVADVPEGQLLEVELCLSELHAVSHPAPGVTKKTLQETAGSYNRPNDGSTVRLTISAASPDGSTEYEAQHDVEYVTDEQKVPEGVELAVSGMKAGERALVTVDDAALTAAPEGAVAGAGVPAGTAPVVYDITLNSFDKTKEKWEMNNQEKLASALARKEKGNAAYKSGNITRAVRQYTQAVETATSINERDLAPNPITSSSSSCSPDTGDSSSSDTPSTSSILSQAKEVKKACCLNLAAAELKCRNWSEAVKQASKVLELDPGNVKALYRRAQARINLSELIEAELDIKAGLLSEPDSPDLAALYRKLKVQLRELNKKEAKLYGKMFAALGKGSSSHIDQGPAAGADAGADADADAPTAMQEDPQPASAAATPAVQAAA